jgi:hypothetical protein
VQTVIWKFRLPLEDVSRIPMPKAAKILKVALHLGELFVWAQVTDLREVQLEPRVFHIYGTGHNIPNPQLLRYIDTVFAGTFVWHIFERLPA